MNKKKIKKLSDEQYNLYIATLSGDAALYNADGGIFAPEEIDRPKEDKKLGD